VDSTSESYSNDTSRNFIFVDLVLRGVALVCVELAAFAMQRECLEGVTTGLLKWLPPKYKVPGPVSAHAQVLCEGLDVSHTPHALGLTFPLMSAEAV